MATLVKWSPFVELDSMERRLRRLFDDIGFAPTLPAADVYETDDEYVVELEVPGFEEKELEIDVFDHRLTVTGERAATNEQADKAFQLHERLERAFERRFYLPTEADTEHVKATFANGVLAVHTPKLAVTKPTKIAIGKE